MAQLNLTQEQQFRLNNLLAIQGTLGIIGLIAGVVYAKKTGGKAIRYIGWGFAGMTAVGLAGMLATTPFKKKLLKEIDEQNNDTWNPNIVESNLQSYTPTTNSTMQGTTTLNILKK